MAEHHITVVIPPSSTLPASVQSRQGNRQSTRDVPPQQQHPQQQHATLQQAHQQHSQKPPHLTQQQLQQYWLQVQGVQQSMDDLAHFVDHVASSSAKSALSLHQATWQERQQLEAIVKQQSVRLQQQAAELEVLRGLARQQTIQQQQQEQPQQSAPQGAGLISSQDRLQQQLEWHRQEVAAWYTKCSNEKQGRQVAESALQDTLVIVEQLEQECAGISSMLRDVMAVDAVAAAAAAAEAASKKRWRPALGLQTTRLGLAVQIGVAVFVAGCAGVASAYIALSVRGC